VTTTLSTSDALEICTDVLFREAELLDANQFTDWLALLDEDLDYEVPIRVTRERSSRDLGFSKSGFHMLETHGSMTQRVRRLEGEHAWAEDPPSRTMRQVTNVRVVDVGAGEISVNNNLLLYRSQGDTSHYDLITGARGDVLTDRGDDGWKLKSRQVLLAHTVLGTPNLAVFL